MLASPEMILAAQPDYTADLIITGMPHGDCLVGRIARSGTALRFEASPASREAALGPRADTLPHAAMLFRVGHPTVMLLQELRANVEMPGDFQHARVIALPAHGTIFHASLIEELVSQEGMSFEVVGTEAVDGYECVTIAGRRQGESKRIRLSAAADLKGLVIRVAGEGGRSSAGYRLRDISLEVPASRFTIPADYSRLAGGEGTSGGDT